MNFLENLNLDLNTEKAVINVINNLIEYYVESNDIYLEENKSNYFVVSMQNDIDQSLLGYFEKSIEDSLRLDIDYELLETSKEKDTYVKDNLYERYFSDTEELRAEIGRYITEFFEGHGYDVYEGAFFPYDGRFISMVHGHIAFVKWVD